ncbi:NAD(P)-dependent oxidoreductase [Roseovarius sp. LXJ103]|uniref:NAD(P)-dependent oxidoreductase n=1 Tax=Roseovarius carneus TaxID=2853164 RepID=UPI0015E7F4B9|nr:NAD(P)-dependent oxidoreductase [Roseovarius carneus]MBZ8118747.1 NAD(P)-dependent oxidoreductase [Roseovarius carneus]
MSQDKIIGFIGTGRIGPPVIRSLLSAGYTVKVHDKYRSAATDVIAAGATWAETPRDVAKGTDSLITCLAQPSHVNEAMLGDNGAAHAMQAEAIWINLSTTDYHSTIRIRDVLKSNGAFCLEAPVSNLSHMGVDFGNSSVYCAGEKAGYDSAKGILEAVAQISFFTGDIGSAQAVKLLTNLIFYGAASISGDCLAISQHAGIPTHWMWEKIAGSPAASVTVTQFIPMLFDGSYDTSCSLAIGVKDMALTLAFAEERGVTLPLSRLVCDRYALAGQVYDPSQNHLKVLKLTEDANDMAIRIPGFIAPSKYGIDPSFVISEQMDTDALGRMTPKLPAHYRAPEFTPTAHQSDLIDTLIRIMAAANHALNAEAILLGQSVGLDRAVIEEMIVWSVGTNWMIENIGGYDPDAAHLPGIDTLSGGLHLPFLSNVLDVLRGV